MCTIRTESNTHWHQDQPYMAVDGWQFCSNWIPLDPITKEITIEFVRGSHKWGRMFAPFDSLTNGSRHPSKVFERCPDIEAARSDYDIISWELEPGDDYSVEETGELPREAARELEVSQLVARGMTNAAIAEELSISPWTVRRHVSNVLSKSGIASR